ncbi:MAG: hypothetical protein IKM04_01850 [Clostridia bacterium]|nr:hypothetical protein [Clostridia bacterium]
MNREEVINKLARTDDERLLAAKLFDKAQRNGVTAFLSPAQRAFAQTVSEQGRLGARFDGGYADAERTVAVFGYADAELSAIRLTIRGKEELTHRDFLGGILALGLKRETLGDIALHGRYADVIASAEAAELILRKLERVGSAAVDAERIELSDFTPPKIIGSTRPITLASLRLDCLIAEIFGLSRSEALKAVSSGLVAVDHVTAQKPSATVSEGSLISLRGHGRARLESLGGLSRKGRQYAEIFIFE